MAVPTSVSLVLSSVISVLLFSVLQIYRPLLSSTQSATILGGFIASWLFIFSLTAVSNLEGLLLGRDFQAKIPEVVICLLLSTIAAGMVHRVCITTCIIFSMIGLYFLTRISHNTYEVSSQADAVQMKKKKK